MIDESELSLQEVPPADIHIIHHEHSMYNILVLTLYKHANAAKLEACSAASLAITFNFFRNDMLLPNRNVITEYIG